MATNSQRIARQAKRKISANVSQEYLNSLEARDFLAECSDNIYDDALSGEEAALLSEYKACDCDLEKWQKMKKRTKNGY